MLRCRVPSNLKDRFENIARARLWTPSQLMRQVVLDFIKAQPQ